ncbi:hypothetical protein JYU34_001179 [Plutella xylostella]|uniref:Uncharacterized protein n=1 Tax=Plutella xylostella TaxID=51655 RepID=A0ABQ7R6A5_PLUXY|nr:hypothetical protein JYU34_001179 [Plutella xylostella]
MSISDIRIRIRIRECPKTHIRHITSQHPSASGDHPTQSYSARMPSLDIPIFDGKNISSYKPFIEMFTAVVHNDHRISNIERLCFLKKYLRGEPLQLIDSLPIVVHTTV